MGEHRVTQEAAPGALALVRADLALPDVLSFLELSTGRDFPSSGPQEGICNIPWSFPCMYVCVYVSTCMCICVCRCTCVCICMEVEAKTAPILFLFGVCFFPSFETWRLTGLVLTNLAGPRICLPEPPQHGVYKHTTILDSHPGVVGFELKSLCLCANPFTD